MPSAQPRECRWEGCQVLLHDRRRRWCDAHQERGRVKARTETNASYNQKRRDLAAAATAPDRLADGGLLLPRPALQQLAGTQAALDAALAEYDRCVSVFVAYRLHGDNEGWAELKREHETRVAFAVTELRNRAREAADALAALTRDRRPPPGGPAT